MVRTGITRRELGRIFAAFGAAGCVRGMDPALSLEHVKLRVSSLDASLHFYSSLFGRRAYLSDATSRAVMFAMGSRNTGMLLSALDAKTPAGLEHIGIDRRGFGVAYQHNLAFAFP